MFMKMIYVFNNAVFQRGAHRNEIKEGYVLNVFAQTDSSRVRANGNAKLGCYQQDCKHFIYASEAAAIDLTKAYCSSLQELLEHHTILAVLTGGHTNWPDRARDLGVSQHVIG